MNVADAVIPLAGAMPVSDMNTDAPAGDRPAATLIVINPKTIPIERRTGAAAELDRHLVPSTRQLAPAVMETISGAGPDPFIGCGARSEMMSLLPASVLLDEIPISVRASSLVAETRTAISRIIAGLDRRLVVVVGPCSIHDVTSAFEYGIKLKALADTYSQQLIVLMRTYCEKPRTSIGWKGLIPDPDLNGTHRINKGLRMARRLIRELNDMGLPTATEFLDLQIPQYLGDLDLLGHDRGAHD